MSNNQKMREAQGESAIWFMSTPMDYTVIDDPGNAKPAHCNAEPRRNCDVGTAEEQARRMNRFCDNYGRYSDGEPKCDGCPLLRKVIEDGGKCELWWAQMPYENGGAE